MIENIIAFLPLTVLIVLAVVTKRMAESMVASALLAMILIHKTNFLSGTIDSLYGLFQNSSYQFVVLILLGFGALMQLMQKSGAMMGFRDVLLKIASGPRKTLLLAWFMSILLFADEFLNAMTVSFSMKDITDNHKIPREHLAFQVHTMACCLAMTIPFSSWTGFTLGLIKEFDLGFLDYVKSIPFMILPWVMIMVCLLLALGLFPKLGGLKTAYERVEEGGDAFEVVEGEENLVDFGDMSGVRASSAWNAVVPLIGLIAGAIYFDFDLIHGLVIALLLQFVIYTASRTMAITEWFNEFFEGCKSMLTIALVLGFGFMVSAANKELGMYDIFTDFMGSHIPGFLIPLVAFLVVGFMTFAVGGCWVVMTIVMPIFLSIAISMGLSTSIMIASVMSGVSLGYCLCFYADALFVATAGTGVSNLKIIHATLPYGLIFGVVSAIGFLPLGML